MASFVLVLASAVVSIGALPCTTPGEVCANGVEGETTLDDISLLQAQLKVENVMGVSSEAASNVSKSEASSSAMVDVIKLALKRTGDKQCELKDTTIMQVPKLIGSLLKGAADPLSMMSQVRHELTAVRSDDVDMKHTIDCLHKAASSMQESDIMDLSSTFVASAISAVQKKPCLEQYVYPASQKLESAFLQLFGAITSAGDVESAVENAEDELESMLHKDESLVNPIQCLLSIGEDEEESSWISPPSIATVLLLFAVVGCICICLGTLLCGCCGFACIFVCLAVAFGGIIMAVVAWQIFTKVTKGEGGGESESHPPGHIFR